MGKHVKKTPPRGAALVASAVVLTGPMAIVAPPAVADDIKPAVTYVIPMAWVQTCQRLGFVGVPDATPGNHLEIPWHAYDETGDLYGVRPWDNQWVTYTEYTFADPDGREYWKVVAQTKDGGPILSPVGQGLNVAAGWVTTDIAPDRAEFIIPQRKG